MASTTLDIEEKLTDEKIESRLTRLSLNELHIPGLSSNLEILDEDEKNLAKMLIEENQSHLFSHWSSMGEKDDEKHQFFDQIKNLNSNYPHGLRAYIQNARKLLKESKEGKNPFEGYTPHIPEGEILNFGDEKFEKYEEEGIKEARNCAFVLVAGGLGERLGYSGIKLALPCESITKKCFLQFYIESILALQNESNKLLQNELPRDIPLTIMTSDDTHLKTIQLLKNNNYFGMKTSQVHLLKQEKVACLSDNNASLALDSKNKFLIETKPHGHGDVHMLLYNSNLLPLWKSNGIKWILFFQDTNVLLFKAIPSSLGVSSFKKFKFNSLCVPRKAKEAIGGITKLVHENGKEMIINVEYNQLDSMLKNSKQFPNGDVNSENGYSPFPGNINQLIVSIDSYFDQLSSTKGIIPEFINPKYLDSNKNKFKSTTRIECMMQDFPKSFQTSENIGFTVIDVWLGYSPVKNNLKDAVKKIADGTPPHSATSAEFDLYRANSLIFKKIGVDVPNPIQTIYANQIVEVYPRVVFSPSWACTYAQIKSKIKRPTDCHLAQNATLVLEGSDIVLQKLLLEGTLIVNQKNKNKIVVDLDVNNKGWELKSVEDDDKHDEEIRIRGFDVVKYEELIID